jgi:hypothetical protein
LVASATYHDLVVVDVNLFDLELAPALMHILRRVSGRPARLLALKQRRGLLLIADIPGLRD